MMNRLLYSLITLVMVLCTGASAQPPGDRGAELRVVTMNIWTGLDYIGDLSMGQWETEERRERRFDLLVRQLRVADPDVLLLQEVSPVSSLSARIAEALGFDEIHQVANAGIKLGPLGIPSNLRDGIAILARPSLRLEQVATWKLSGSPGIHGDILSLHFDEAEFALVGRVRHADVPMYIVNTHLSATPRVDDALVSELRRRVDAGEITASEADEGIARINDRRLRRIEEVRELADRLRELDPAAPVILGGDFNTSIESGELADIIDSLDFRSALPDRVRSLPTWDPQGNPNVLYSTRLSDAQGRRHTPDAIVSAIYDERPRVIDHIFVNSTFEAGALLGGDIILDTPDSSGEHGALFASDHYGVLAVINPNAISPGAPRYSDSTIDLSRTSLDALPIATYDTDAGFGYGAKGYLLNQLGGGESFDLTLFNSTEGERWYRLLASWPDVELRHRRVFAIAADVELDYDKWTHNSYFGVGAATRFSDRRQYTREPFEAALTLSRGLTTDVVAQLGMRYTTVSNANPQDSSSWRALPAPELWGRASWMTIGASLRVDTRSSTLHPTRGIVVQASADIAPGLIDGIAFTKLGTTLQWYATLWHPTTVLALRIAAEGMVAPDVHVHALLSLGGGNSLRGSPQDRFLDRIMAVANAELRFPIYGRLGAVAGYDAGRVWSRLDDVGVDDWAANPVVGLRFLMDTFVVRLDVGFGQETTGMYFNFGHMF